MSEEEKKEGLEITLGEFENLVASKVVELSEDLKKFTEEKGRLLRLESVLEKVKKWFSGKDKLSPQTWHSGTFYIPITHNYVAELKENRLKLYRRRDEPLVEFEDDRIEVIYQERARRFKYEKSSGSLI